MAEKNPKNVFEDLDLSRDEVDKFKKAFEDPEFRKLFKEYAEEINDPENKKRYEEEIAQMERDKGMDIKFINPIPGHVLKTFENGTDKIFINICHNDLIGKPSCSKESGKKQSGTCWSLPHSFTPPRDDIDKKKAMCKVYDVIFHPDTYYMSTKNERFRNMVESIALDGIEKQFSVQLDKKNFKRLKIKFKGNPVASVIRTKRPDYEDKHNETVEGPLGNFPYPYDPAKDSAQIAAEHASKATNPMKQTSKNSVGNKGEPTKESPYSEPTYSIKYSNNFDIQDFTENTELPRDTRPDKMIIEIHLPLLRSAASCDLDITERQLKLQSEKPAAYMLTLKLAYPVDESKGSARFDKSTKRLIVTLPVIAMTAQDGVLPNGDCKITDLSTVSKNTAEINENTTPLIEVLNSKTVEDEEQLDDDDDEEVEVHKKVIENGFSKNASNLMYEDCNDFKSLCTSGTKIPEVKFLQDSETLIVLLLVKHVESNTLRVFKEVESEEATNCVAITFSCRGTGGWPMHFLLILKCKVDECNLFDADIQIEHNIQVENTTISFNVPSKHSKLSELWFGSPTDLNEYSFNTGGDILSLLAELGSCNLECPDASFDLNCHVTDMNKNCVSIVLLTESDIPVSDKQNKIKFSCESTEEQLSDPNEECNEESHNVIIIENNKSKRPQKSILKLSNSESSEEGSIPGADFHSPISPLDFPCNEDDDDVLTASHSSGQFPLRKSVSFSHRPQQAVYTPGDPVTSLHQTLRNRRKKAKRQKRGGIQRRFSESEKDLVTFRSDSSSSNSTSPNSLKNSFDKASLKRSQKEKEELALAQNNSEWGPRRRNLSEGDLEQLKVEDNSKNANNENNNSKVLAADSAESEINNSVENSSSTSVSESGFVNWANLPTVKDTLSNNPHRTSCPVQLSNTMTFELDDD